MQDSACDIRHVLEYLEKAAEYCQQQRRQDLQWEYEEAAALVSGRMFGQLPPRKKIVAPDYSFHQPPNPQLPRGFRPAKLQQPLRAIVAVNPRPHGHETVLWEMLDCKHELMAPPGYSNPAKRRRCIYCAFVQSQSTAGIKKPSASVAIAKKKAVGA